MKPSQQSSAANEQIAEGRLFRKHLPRRTLGSFEPRSDRPDPIELLMQQASSRVPELLPIRYGRMSESPFAFFRGAAAIMAVDICPGTSTGMQVQLCGDAHLSNFGIFSSPSRGLVFDCNDFDETLPGPWEWDVKRLVASLTIAGRHLGFSDGTRSRIVSSAVARYRGAMHDFAGMRSLAVWYTHVNVDEALKDWEQIDRRHASLATKIGAKARSKDSVSAFQRLTEVVDGERRFVSSPPLMVPVRELMTGTETDEVFHGLRETLRRYRLTLSPDRQQLLDSYHLVDATRRVVGVGSVGTNAWVALLLGDRPDDPLVLQFKEATESVLEPYAKKNQYLTHGRRVVEGQRLMQATSDILLGWEQMDGPWGGVRDFYVRQLWDGKYSADVNSMTAGELREYAAVCAWTLARAHARSGNRFKIAGYVGGSQVLDNAMAAFAESYADQNDRDYAMLTQAISEGRVEAQLGI